ncbi:hypothetical protein GCM10022248_00760 [Nonomuraea soli]
MPAQAARNATAAASHKPACVTERPDVSSALTTARLCDLKVEVTSLTTESLRVHANPEGTLTAEQHAGPVRVRRDKSWTTVDLTLQHHSDGSVSAKAHPRDLKLSGAKAEGEHELATAAGDGGSVALVWTGALPTPQLDGASATYPEIRSGVDLVVNATPTGFEQFLVVKNRAGLAHVRSTPIALRAKGWKTVADGADGFAFTDAAGRVRARSPQPLMWDARKDKATGEPLAVTKVAARMRKTVGELSLTPDQAWLNAPDRQFPIVIDPQVTIGPSFDTFVRSNEDYDRSGMNMLELGRTTGDPVWTSRSFLHWNTAPFAGGQVSSATVHFWNWYSTTCAQTAWELWSVGSFDASVRWHNQPEWRFNEATSTQTKGLNSSCDDGWVTIDGRGFFQRAANELAPVGYMGLKAADESRTDSWKQFRSINATASVFPYALVTYTAAPQVSSPSTSPTTSCATGTARPYMTSRTPQLRVTVSDAEGAAANVAFEWRVAGAADKLGEALATGAPSGTVASVTVPGGQFAEGGAYAWRARASDSVGAGAWSPWCEFTVDSVKPGAPFVSSADYPADGRWYGKAGQAGTFTFRPATDDADVVGYRYQLDTDTAPRDTTDTTVSIAPPEEGHRTLTVWAKDRAGNLSENPAVHRFLVGKAGLAQPDMGATVVKRMKIAVDRNDPAYTRVTFQYRRGPGSVESDIPLANLRKANGDAITQSRVPLADLGAHATWNAMDTLGSIGGVADVRALLYTANDADPPYATAWVRTTVDPNGDGAAATEVGPGSINLLTGDHTLSATDVNELGLQVNRVASSREPTEGWIAQGQLLSANQTQVSADVTGFDAQGTSTLVRATGRGQGSSTDSLEITPVAASGDTFAALGGDFGALRLGMKPGRRYRASAWIYVPAATGLNLGYGNRGQQILAFYKDGSGYREVASRRAAWTDGWQELTVDLQIPPGASEAFIRLYNGATGGSGKKVYWDNISVREVLAPFGPQWRGGAGDGVVDGQYTTLEFPELEMAHVSTVTGGWVTFSRNASGAFFPEPGAEGLSLTKVSEEVYRLSELGDSTTEFTKRGQAFVATATWTSEASSTSRYLYDTTDNRALLKRVINPQEAGVGDCTAAVPARGCEVLEYDYATTTTATAAAQGDYADRVRSVKVWTWDPQASAMSAVEVARYAYDAQGRLREVWDPRLSQALKNTYDYDTTGRVVKVAAPGELPWMFDYTGTDVDTPALRWDLDDMSGTTVTDSSGNSRTGAFSGGGRWEPGDDVADPADGGAGFTGTHPQQLAAAGPAVPTNKSFTVSAWVHPTNAAVTRTAVSQDGARTSGFFFNLIPSLNRWAFSMVTSDNEAATPVRALSTGPPALNAWTHLTGVYDAAAGQLRLYVNGVLQGSAAYSAAWDASGPFVVGRAKWNASTNTNLWHGGVDDVRVYPKVLSTSQITALALQDQAGRLLRVRRATLAAGSKDQVDGEVATNVVYNVPLTRAGGGPHDMDHAAVSTWAQQDVPTDATAVFGPETPPAVHFASASAPGSGGYGTATVHYLNASGQETNTATPGGHIDTTEYDRFGNVVRTLEATNRTLALGTHPEAATLAGELSLPAGTAIRAQLLSSYQTYSGDGLDLIDTLGPLTRIVLESGLSDPTGTLPALPAGSTALARAHGVNVYDEGKPDGYAYHLITTEIDGAKVDGYPADADRRVVRHGYTAEKGGTSGWKLRKATSSTTDAGSAYVVFDDAGRAHESWGIGANGSDARTKKTIFYTAGANTADAACGNRPEWAGQPCVTSAAGAVTGHDPARMPGVLPVKRVEAYSRFGEPTVVTETAAGKTRRGVTVYDGADRITRMEITSDEGVAIMPVTTEFDPVTGDVVKTTMGSVSVIREYDKLGRLVSYTDADGGVTRNEFDRYGKPTKVVDPTGWMSFTYDRAAEPRGLLTSVTDSVAGTFTARYSPDGQPVQLTYPGGITRKDRLDAAFNPVERTFTRTGDGQILYAESIVENTAGQWVAHTYTGGAKRYGYDKLGRLTKVDHLDSLGQCTSRAYEYDARTNRKHKQTFAPAADGTCQSETAEPSSQHAHDSADRLTDAGFTYDAFGRSLTTPGGPSNTFYVNDLVAAQHLGDTRRSWTLDPIHRLRGFVTEREVNGQWTQASSKVNHYGDDSDEPRWIVEDAQGTVTRMVSGPDGDLVATTSAGGDVRLQLNNLHGDVALTIDPALTAPQTYDYDEFGIARPQQDDVRYGWLGGKQRSGEALGDTILMGVRLYSPTLGRFLQTDPVAGGSCNAYDYVCQDPVNQFDLDGRWGWFKKALNVVAKVAEVASYIPGPIGTIAGGISAVSYAATGNWRKAGEMALVAAANLVGAGAAVKVGFAVARGAARGIARAGASIGSWAAKKAKPYAYVGKHQGVGRAPFKWPKMRDLKHMGRGALINVNLALGGGGAVQRGSLRGRSMAWTVASSAAKAAWQWWPRHHARHAKPSKLKPKLDSIARKINRWLP